MICVMVCDTSATINYFFTFIGCRLTTKDTVSRSLFLESFMLESFMYLY